MRFYRGYKKRLELKFSLFSGIIAVGEVTTFTLDVNRFKCDKVFVKDESELFDKFLSVIRRWDPDMLIGYEVDNFLVKPYSASRGVPKSNFYLYSRSTVQLRCISLRFQISIHLFIIHYTQQPVVFSKMMHSSDKMI